MNKMTDAYCIEDILKGIDSFDAVDSRLKNCMKITLQRFHNKGYLDVTKIELLKKAYQNSIEDVRAILWFIKTKQAITEGLNTLKDQYAEHKTQVMTRKHSKFYSNLNNRDHILLGWKPQFGSWDKLKDEIRNGVVAKPELYTMLKNGGGKPVEAQVERAISSIEKMSAYETKYSIDLLNLDK